MKFVLFGLGREGRSNYRFLRQLFPDTPIILSDDKPLPQLNPLWKSILVQDNLTSFATAQELPNSALKAAILVVTPGIAPTHPLLNKAESFTPITTNTQLFLEICLPDRARHSILASHLPRLHHQPLVIGVTGTKGKSTTTAAIAHLLKTAQLPTLLGGNIGQPPLELLPDLMTLSQTAQTMVVLELSSHQLSRVNISPQIAVVQSISPEHLDYYSDFRGYVAAKSQLVSFQQPADRVIFFADNQQVRKIVAMSPAEQLGFGLDASSSQSPLQATLINHSLMYRDQPVIDVRELGVVGQHNAINLMPALVIGKLLHLPDATIKQAFKTFQSLPHRLQLVLSRDNVDYVNDSLATTPEAAMAAIASFPDRPIVLIAGGYDRGLNYQPLAHAIVRSSVKAVVALPTTGSRIIAGIEGERPMRHIEVAFAPDLTTAMHKVKDLVKSGDVVLLSPASASFNQFRDYAERGNKFAELAANLSPSQDQINNQI